EHHRAQAHADHAVDGPGNDHEARPLGVGQELAEPEDDTTLVLVEDLDAQEDPEDQETEGDEVAFHHAPFRTRRRRPSMPTTSTRAPGSSGPSACARHRSPCTPPRPPGCSDAAAPPERPTSPSAPVVALRRCASTTMRTRRIVKVAMKTTTGSSFQGSMRSSGSGESTSIIAPRIIAVSPATVKSP